MTIENFDDACGGIDDVMNFVMHQNTKMVLLEDQNKQLNMTISADRENYDALAKDYREARDERQRLSEVLAQERFFYINTEKQLKEAMDEIRKLRTVLLNITEALKPVVEVKPEEPAPVVLEEVKKEPEPAPTHNVYVGAGYADPHCYPMPPREAEAHKDDYIPLPRAVGDEYRF